MESKNYGTVICSECGTRVDIDDAEAAYNAELDDVFWYCSKCINDPAYLPVISNDDDDEEQYLCERCGYPESEHPVHGCVAFAFE